VANDEADHNSEQNAEPDVEQNVAPDATPESAEASADGSSDPSNTAQATDADELANAKDQLLRTIAEMENVRRRSSREVENARKFAVEGLLSDLLPVLDSLEKAVETAQNTAGAEAIAEGVELSLKLFSDSLGRFGVEQIDPLGAPFDPQQHEAMAMVPNADAEPNSVMEVMQRGYTLNGRLVRAAKVIVTKAP
jgi:molecular chaperone GrpE